MKLDRKEDHMNEQDTTGGDNQVEQVVQAYLDYLEGLGPEPLLEELNSGERNQATALINSLRAGRGIDPYASRPPLEALLAGTEFEGALTTRGTMRELVDVVTVCDVLTASAPKAEAAIDIAGDGTETVIFDYLDLRARFVLVPGGVAVLTDQARALAQRLLDQDPFTSYVGLVSSEDPELTTQLLTATDLGPTVTTPRGNTQAGWLPMLPLEWAAQQVLERGAPEWEPFEFEPGAVAALDVSAIAIEIARQVIEREASRSYRGDKSLAYKSLAGQEGEFSELVDQVAAHGATAVDLEAETARMSRDAA